jgi:hypothetical protein
VNAARRTGRFTAAEFSEPSDGFDDFGDASNLATAVVQQPSLSEDSLPAADPQRRPPSGVFTNDRRASLSEDDEFDTPGVGDLADSRVAPRPHIPGLDAAVPAGVAPSLPPQLGPLAAPVARPAPPPASPWVAPPTRPPTAAPPALPSGSDGGAPLNDVELAAMTGAVWSDNGNVKVNPGLLPDWRAAVTASPTQRPARRGERSTSLSELLDSSDDGPAAETGAAPALPAAVDDLSAEPTLSAVPIPGPANPRAGDNGDEPTAFRPPPMPMPPVPLVARRPDAAPSAPDDDFDPGATLAVESPLRLAPAPSPAAPPPAPAIPAAAAPAPAAPIGPPAPRTAPAGNDAQADADLFDGDGGGEGTDGAIPMLSETRDLSVSHAGAMRYPPPPQPQPLPLPASLPASLAKAPATLDYTAPPSQDAASGDSDDDADDDADDDSDDDSAEQLDSEMVVRPAARASPPSAASPAPAPRPPASPAPAYGSPDDDDFMVDPDATMNLPARPKSMEGRHRREVEAAPPPPVVAEEPAARGRRPPTEDMRRKARLLFEQALKDHASGKLGAARMNVKLATIYDPTVAEYAQLLEQWEDKPRAPTAQPAASNRPEYVELYERAQELEDDGDIDGALEALERGLPLAPNAAAFHNRIGVILAMRRREFDRAAAEIERAIALEPENAHYRSNLGKVMARANRRRDVGASAR